MGKESLFFRWLELLQYESNRAGVPPAERRKAILESAKRAFAEQHIDFDDFIEHIGGVSALPGLEQDGLE